jgi:hypothetical protein
VGEEVGFLKAAVLADYVVLGGGNAKKVRPLPRGASQGGNENAFVGGFRLWETSVAHLDRHRPAQDVYRLLL